MRTTALSRNGIANAAELHIKCARCTLFAVGGISKPHAMHILAHRVARAHTFDQDRLPVQLDLVAIDRDLAETDGKRKCF